MIPDKGSPANAPTRQKDTNDDTDVSFHDLSTWPIQLWILIIGLAWVLSVFAIWISIADREYSVGDLLHPALQFTIGVAIIQYAVAFHLFHYPALVLGLIDAVEAAITALWNSIPVIYWEPWYVSSGASLIGVIPVGNALRLAFTRGGDS